MNLYWITALARQRLMRLVGAAFGVAITVALLASLGFFLVGSSASMTQRAVASVPIDWQVEAVPAADPQAIRGAIGKATRTTSIHSAFYARINGLQANTGSTVQTTGPGKVIAFDAGYLKDFPKEIRLLSGTLDGVLIAQQTAANLHVGPGDVISINRIGLDVQTVTISGVVDLPDADALFQAVGLPPQAAPQAPPDNVLILPAAQWHQIFDPQQAVRPDTTRQQFHVRLDHAALSALPTQAFTDVTGAARNLEVKVAGRALVANNLGARLDAVRGDALYATVLFLFLGVPGVALAATLTIVATASGAGRRRLEQALLRLRGAATGRILSLSGSEAAATGIIGVLLGLLAAFAYAQFTLQIGYYSPTMIYSAVLAAFAGGLLALAAILLPTWITLRGQTVMTARRSVGLQMAPLWQRAWLDVIFLALSALLFWQSASTGYQVVLAPEGVPATSVDYKAFLTPALFWIGSALLTVRLAMSVISANGPVLRWMVWPVSGRLAETVTASLSRQAGRITLGITMTALAVSFATSTSIFNTTYNAQARVDAELTNGADVTVFGTLANPAGPHIGALAKIPGVLAVQPMQHRFAYVGADLQDMYGIDPAAIGSATSLSNAFFSGATVSEILASLAKTPEGVLVSEETVRDFQLNPGDTVNLRMMSAANHQYTSVPFKFIGIAREFPTAPKDSFLVANAAYIAKMTGNDAAEYVLMRSGVDPALLAARARKVLTDTPALQVRDLSTASHIIGSSLTAVDLSSLTRIELLFAIILAASAAGLVPALGFNDRRRDFAILTAIGAKPAQLGAFLWAEGALVGVIGVLLGLASGIITAWMLVKLLTGVFDPPPEALVIPWIYISLVLALLAASIAGSVIYAGSRSTKEVVEGLRDF